VLERSAADVWAEVRENCRRHMAAGDPVLTLDKRYANVIEDVNHDGILRRSDHSRRGTATRVEGHRIRELWTQLALHGEITVEGDEGKPLGTAMALALLAELPGVGHTVKPRRLFFTDRELAMRPWGDPRRHDGR
jgi:hypothetical protein